MTEGTQTEPLYFKAIADKIAEQRGGNIDIRVEGCGRGTVALVERCEELVSRSPFVYQHIWVVFDKDDFEDFDEAIQLASTRGYQVAWSNQAFEFWCYLHFEYCDAALSRADWAKKLDEIFCNRGISASGYRKNMSNLYELLNEHGSERFAAGCARNLLDRAKGKKPSEVDPATTVHLLVSELNGFLNGNAG